MAINMMEILSLKSRGILQEVESTLSELKPVAEQLLQRGYPLTKQVQKIEENLSWAIKMMEDFQVPKSIQS